MKRTALLRRTRLRPVSKKRRGENSYYSKKRVAFLERFQWCACAVVLFGKPKRATEIHHKEGRAGTRYLDEATWLPVCRDSHVWIHAHPKEARARGWLI